MAKIRDVYRWIYGHITGKPTNFNWIIMYKNNPHNIGNRSGVCGKPGISKSGNTPITK
jgi:hypothetical protein